MMFTFPLAKRKTFHYPSDVDKSAAITLIEANISHKWEMETDRACEYWQISPFLQLILTEFSAAGDQVGLIWCMHDMARCEALNKLLHRYSHNGEQWELRPH